MRTVTLLSAILLLMAGCSDAPDYFFEGTIVDLTYSYDSTTVYWPTASGFSLQIDAKGWQEGGYYYEANSFESAEHGGTHLDAPIHFAEGKWTTDAIPLDRLIGNAVVVDVSDRALGDRDYLVSTADFRGLGK